MTKKRISVGASALAQSRVRALSARRDNIVSFELADNIGLEDDHVRQCGVISGVAPSRHRQAALGVICS